MVDFAANSLMLCGRSDPDNNENDDDDEEEDVDDDDDDDNMDVITLPLPAATKLSKRPATTQNTPVLSFPRVHFTSM